MAKATKKLRIEVIGNGAQTRRFSLGRIVVGRSEQCDLSLPITDLSRKHLEIAFEDGTLWVKDLGSSNGSYLKKQRLAPQLSYPLPENETLNLANAVEIRAQIVIEDEAATSGQAPEPELPKISVIKVPVEMAPPLPTPSVSLEASSPELRLENKSLTETNERLNLVNLEVAERLQSARQQEASLKLKVEELQQATQSAQAKLQQIQDSLKAEESRIEESRQKSFEFTQREAQLEKRVAQLQENADEQESRVASARRALEEIQAEHSETLGVIKDFEKAISQKQMDSENLKAELSALEARRLTQQQQFEAEQKSHSARLAQWAQDEAQSRRSIEQLMEDLKRLQHDKDQWQRNHQDQLRHFQSESRRIELESAATKAKIEVDLAQLQKDRIIAEQETSLAKLEFKRIEKEFQLRQDDVSQLSKQWQKLQDEIQLTEQRKHQIKSEIQSSEIKLQQERDRQAQLQSETHKMQSLKQSAERELSQAQAHSDEWMAAHRQKAELQAAEALAKARLELSQIESQMQSERHRLLQEAQSEAAQLKSKAQSEAEKLKQETEELAQNEKRKFEQFSQSAREQLDRELKAYKTAETNKLNAFIESEVSRHQERRGLEREAILSQLELHLGRELKGVLKPELEQRLPEIVREIVSLNTEVLNLDEIRLRERSLKHYKGADPLAAKLAKKKLIQLGAKSAAAMALVFILLFTSVPKSTLTWVSRAFQPDQEAAERRLAKIEEERERAFYRPTQDKEWRSTYAENIVYLEGYLQLKTDSEMQQKWTVVLNEFLMKDLKLNERAVVQAIPIETELVSELSKIAKNLKTESLGVQKERMQKLETVMVERLGLAIGGEFNYPKLRELERRFYEQNSLSLRRPASDPTE